MAGKVAVAPPPFQGHWDNPGREGERTPTYNSLKTGLFQLFRVPGQEWIPEQILVLGVRLSKVSIR